MVTIKDIAERTGTSIATVSRVLNGVRIRDAELAQKIRDMAQTLQYRPSEAGRRLRTGDDSEFGPAFDVRSKQELLAKQAIATRAALLLQCSDVIILDSGSTVAELAYHLPSDALVYTNSLAVLQPASRCGAHVHLAPGLYIPEMAAVFGEETEEFFRRHGSSLYFVSAERVDVRTGLFNMHPSTFGVKKVVLQQARKKILMVHHDKFCDAGLTSFAPLSVVDLVITDFIPDAFRAALMESGVEVIETEKAEGGSGFSEQELKKDEAREADLHHRG